MTSTPLSLTVTAPEFDLDNGVYRKSGTTPGGRLGSVDFSVSGGVGTKTARIKSQPEWAAAVLNQSGDNANSWTLGGDVGLPPLVGMSGLIIVEITDSAVSPAAVEATLGLSTIVPAEQSVLRSADSEALRFVRAHWPLVYSKRSVNGDDTLDLAVRQHLDGRIIAHVVFQQGRRRHEEAIVAGPTWQAGDICRVAHGSWYSSCASMVHDALVDFALTQPPVLV